MTQQVFRLQRAIGVLAGLMFGSLGGYWLGLQATAPIAAIAQDVAHTQVTAVVESCRCRVI